MKKNSQLSYIMNILKISGVQLAGSIGVDRTLVSKWKNNVRTLSHSSLHFDNLVDNIILFNSEQNASTLERFFTRVYPNYDRNEPSYLKTCISTWLHGDDLGHFFNIDVNQQDKDVLYSTSVDIYKGDYGKRMATLNILDYALSLPPGQEIYISDMEDLNWLNNDESYTKIIFEKFLKVLTKGDNITIIHNFDRKSSEITEMMLKWIPLYLTGKLTSYYISDVNLCKISPSLYIIHNHIALFSVNLIPNDSNNRYITIYSDPFTIKQMYEVFINRLKHSLQLVSSYHIQSAGIKGFIKNVISHGESVANTYFTSPLPLHTTMKRETLEKILCENNVPKDKYDSVLEIYDETLTFFKKDLNDKYFRQFFDFDKIKEALSSSNFLCYELSSYAHQPIFISNSLFIDHITSTIEILKENKNYEIQFLPMKNTTFEFIGTWVKENSFIYSYPQNGSKYVVLSDTKIIVDIFYSKLNNIWNSNIEMDKNNIIKKLQSLI